MDWFKKHGDTVIILAAVLGGFWNMNTRMWDLNEKMGDIETRLTNQINGIDRRVTAIETIMIMQGCPLRALSENVKNEKDSSK